MAFVSELFDTLRDLTNDATDSQVTFATKKLYLNRGIARMWPAVWRVQSTTIVVTTGAYDYALPVAAADGHVISVELEQVDGSFQRFEHWDIISGDEDTAGIFRISVWPDDPAYLGMDIRVKYAAPVPLITSASYAAAGSETWSGPDRAIGIPCYYAMSLISARKIDDRQDTLRMSTTQATNGVTDNDIMSSSQMWMGQFELELAAVDKPLPPSRD